LKKDDSWTIEQPKPKAMGPYAYKDNQWVGYDDEEFVKLKVPMVKCRKHTFVFYYYTLISLLANTI